MEELPQASKVLAELRKYLGYTQEEFAEHLGYQTITISKIEQGKRKISRSVIDSLAAFLQISTHEYDSFALRIRQGASLVSYAPPVQGIQKSALIRDPSDLELIEEHLVERFLGREQQLAELETLINSGARVLLVGFPGIGKTSIAAEIVARRVREGMGPVLWVEVGHESGKALLMAIVHPIDSKNAAAMAGEERLGGTVRDLVRQAGVKLIVLENVWSTDLSTPLKAIPPGVAVLVTSPRRVLLSASTTSIQLKRLGAKSALRLLSHHARKDLTRNQEASALCKALAHHPLALKLAGGLLAEHYTPAEVLDSFKGRLHDVPSLYLDDPRTISFLINENLEELQNPEARQVFAAFGTLFAPRAPAPLIARLFCWEPGVVKRALLELEVVNLVKPVVVDGLVVHTMHELAYSFARESVEADERRRAIDVCVHYAVECGQARNLAALHAARDNLLGAANAAIQTNEDDDRLVRLIGALVTCGYFDARGYSTVALLPLEKAAILAEGAGQTEQAHYIWAKLGNAYANFLGNPVGGFAAYMRALDTAPSPARAAISNSLLGTVCFRQGKEAEANSFFDKAEYIACQHDDRLGLSIVFEHRGTMAALFNKDYVYAQRCFQRSLEVAHTIENLQACAPRLFFAYINLCGAEHELGKLQSDTARFVQASDFAEQALDIAREMGSDVLMSYAFNEKGRQELALNNRVEAEKFLRQALRLFVKIGDRVRENALLRYAEREGLTLKG